MWSKLHNCTLYRGVGNNILFGYYTAAAPFSLFTLTLLLLLGGSEGETRSSRGPSERNGTCKVPAPCIYQKLPE